MLNLSVAKIVVVLAIALIVLGPERLPPLVRQAGKWLGDLKRLRESVQSEVKGVLGDLPGGISGAGGKIANPLAGVESPFAGLQESVSSIGDSLRSVLGTGAAGSASGVAGVSATLPGSAPSGPLAEKRPLPPPGHSNRNPDGSPMEAAFGSGDGLPGTVGGTTAGARGGAKADPAPFDPSLN